MQEFSSIIKHNELQKSQMASVCETDERCWLFAMRKPVAMVLE